MNAIVLAKPELQRRRGDKTGGSVSLEAAHAAIPIHQPKRPGAAAPGLPTLRLVSGTIQAPECRDGLKPLRDFEVQLRIPPAGSR